MCCSNLIVNLIQVISVALLFHSRIKSLYICVFHRRPLPTGSKTRKIPYPTKNPFTWIFLLVSCPNYTYEVMSRPRNIFRRDAALTTYQVVTFVLKTDPKRKTSTNVDLFFLSVFASVSLSPVNIMSNKFKMNFLNLS